VRTPRTLVVALVAATAAVSVAACGSDNGDSPAGNGTDLAFAQQMSAHHQDAIDMAKIAQEHAQSSYIKTLADDIIGAQQGEIAVLDAASDDLKGLDVQPADLGIDEAMSGMNMDPDALATADPFDREFIDMMIPHHQGAIRMARAEINQGSSPALTKLAQQIIDTQAQEIQDMNAFRAKTYGSPSPAGGVPADHEDNPSTMPGMDHGG
jgi:uncharacterized protein (DUF305 family)